MLPSSNAVAAFEELVGRSDDRRAGDPALKRVQLGALDRLANLGRDLRALDPDYAGPLEPGSNSEIVHGHVPKCAGVWLRTHCR